MYRFSWDHNFSTLLWNKRYIEGILQGCLWGRARKYQRYNEGKRYIEVRYIKVLQFVEHGFNDLYSMVMYVWVR